MEEAAILTATLSSSVLVRLILLVTSGEDWAVDVDGGGIGGEVIDFGATIGLVAFGEDNGGSTPPLPSATVAAAFLRSAARCKRRLAAGLSRFFPPAAVGLVPPLLALDEGDRYAIRAVCESRCASGAGHEPWDRATRATANDETAIAAGLARLVILIMSRGLDSGVCFRMATASASESM